MKEFIYNPQEHKQLKSVHIPVRILKTNHNIKDQMKCDVSVSSNGIELYRNMLSITSGKEISIPAELGKIMAQEKEVTFTIM